MEKRKKLLWISLCLVVVLGLTIPASLSAEASPATIYVPDNYTTIQGAVNAASPGDTIIVRDGTYTENIKIYKDHLTIKSENGAGTTMVQAADSEDCVFWIFSDYIVISGFTVKDATGIWQGDPQYRVVGIYVMTAEYCNVLNNIADNNYFGIAVGYSATHNNIINNNALHNDVGIGIYYSFSSNVVKEEEIGSPSPPQLSSYLFSSLPENYCDNTVFNNQVIDNVRGISSVSSINNRVCFNNFLSNEYNVYSYNSTNMWNSLEKITYTYNGNIYTNNLGNYWSDYTGSDTDGDGIGDTPYGIDSDTDNYPLMEPFENYVGTVSVALEEFGDGRAQWTSEVAHSGSYSIRLCIPDGAAHGSWAIARVSYGEPLNTLELFSSYLYTNATHHPRFAIYLDKTGDGQTDSMLLSDYLDLEGGTWTAGTGGLLWGWTEASYPPGSYGNIWEPYDYWQSLYGDATVLSVAVVLEYWAVEADALGQPLYVDDVIINGIRYDLEPQQNKAAGLARQVVGAEYQEGGKGWSIDYEAFLEPSQIKAEKYHYWYWDKNEKVTKLGYGKGLDCSGLIFWAYNKAYGATKYLGDENPVQYEGADGQYRHNFREDISDSDLMPGDLLFFDWDADGNKDHVAMFVGSNGNGYDVVNASSPGVGIVWAKKEGLVDLEGFCGFRRLTEAQIGVKFEAHSPVDLIVTDPDGFTITRDIYEIAGTLYYLEWDIDGDGELDDMVIGPEQKPGDYLITIVPDPNADPFTMYSLKVSTNNITVVLADHVQIIDIPIQGYIIRSTETEIMQIIPATIDFDPDTLNLKSKGKFLTVYIELPLGCDVSKIDISSIMLNGVVSALAKPTEISDYDSDSIPDLMVKFDRAAVLEILAAGKQVEITIAGKVTGIDFEGSDTIWVIDK